MLHLLLRQLATSCWPFFSAYFFLGLLRRQTTIKMQTNWICVRKVWLFWLSVLRHKLTAQNGATNNNPCLFVVLCCRTRARNIFAVANDLRRKLACRYFNCNRLPGNLSGTRKCCHANCRQNLRKKKNMCMSHNNGNNDSSSNNNVANTCGSTVFHTFSMTPKTDFVGRTLTP